MCIFYGSCGIVSQKGNENAIVQKEAEIKHEVGMENLKDDDLVSHFLSKNTTHPRVLALGKSFDNCALSCFLLLGNN